MISYSYIQDDSEGKVSILGVDSISHLRKKVCMNMFLIPSDY
jgi:hypothetical protein